MKRFELTGRERKEDSSVNLPWSERRAIKARDSFMGREKMNCIINNWISEPFVQMEKLD